MPSRASGSATGVPDDPAGSGTGSSLLRFTLMGLVDIVLLAVVLVVGVSVATWALVGTASGSTSGVAANVFAATSVRLASILTLAAALRRWRHGLPVWPWLGLTLACHVWLGQGSGSGQGRVVTVAWLVGAVLLVLPAIPAVMATPASPPPGPGSSRRRRPWRENRAGTGGADRGAPPLAHGCRRWRRVAQRSGRHPARGTGRDVDHAGPGRPDDR